MELSLQLALKHKPMVRCLLNEDDGYLSSTVAEVLNDIRLFGHSQLLVHSSFGEGNEDYKEDRAERMKEAINKFQTQLNAMALGGEAITVTVTDIDSSSRRVDVILREEK